MSFYRLIYPDMEDDVVILTDYDLHGFKYTDFLVGKSIKNWDSNIKLYYEKEGKLEDYLSNPLGWPILSQRMVDLFNKMNISKVEYFPANISHKASGKKINGYFVANIIELIPALDLEKSVYKSWDDRKGVVHGLRKPVIRDNKIRPEIYIFRLTEYPFWLLISEKLKEVLLKEKIMGVDFWEVETS